ncbi:MAG: low temperature requirement protein A [Rhodobacterales bacterium]|nr:low temperature requirement protein A [Rhodobacterales bacterium]
MKALLRPLRPRNPDDHHRVATTLELFFDLVTVIAMASATAALHHGISAGHGLEALVPFVFLFFGIWWAWMNFTWFASAFDNDSIFYRICVMVIIGGELLFAGAVPFIFDGHGQTWGLLGWSVMRLGMVALWLRAAQGEYRTTCLRYAIGVTVAQCCWALAFFLAPKEAPDFFYWAGLVYLVELAVPLWAERAKATPFHRHHIIERYGLLMIISLGEILLSISLGFGALNGEHPSMGAGMVAASGVIMVFAVWWVYYCEEEHLMTTKMPEAIFWGYGHVFVFLSTALLGAAVAAEVDLNADHSKIDITTIAKWMGSGLALFCLSLWFVRDRPRALTPHLKWALPGMAALFLIAGFLGAPAWVFALLAVVMVIWRAPRAAGIPHHDAS